MTTAFQQLASTASEKYRETILSIAQGNEHAPETVMQIARDAGRSAPQLAADVDTATDRFEAQQAHHARDWGQEIEQAKAAYVDAVKVQEEASEACTTAQEAARNASQESQRLLSLRSTLEQQRKAADDKYMKEMRATAGDDRNTSDWKNFRLAD